MEFGWFLTGLAYCALAYPEKRQELEVPASQVYKLLTKKQGDRGFFGHQSALSVFAGMLRGRIGSFADQVYPIYALTQFSKAFQHPDALAARFVVQTEYAKSRDRADSGGGTTMLHPDALPRAILFPQFTSTRWPR